MLCNDNLGFPIFCGTGHRKNQLTASRTRSLSNKSANLCSSLPRLDTSKLRHGDPLWPAALAASTALSTSAWHYGIYKQTTWDLEWTSTLSNVCHKLQSHVNNLVEWQDHGTCWRPNKNPRPYTPAGEFRTVTYLICLLNLADFHTCCRVDCLKFFPVYRVVPFIVDKDLLD